MKNLEHTCFCWSLHFFVDDVTDAFLDKIFYTFCKDGIFVYKIEWI